MWTPLFSFMVFVIFMAIGDWVSSLTKSRISGLLIAMIFYLVGFQTGIIPADSIASTGLPTIAGGFAIALLLVSMGTMIELPTLLAQWKTVSIALFALVGLALASFTVSSWIVGREWALAASAPISGGIIAGQMTSAAAMEAGRNDLAAFAMLVIGCQGFVGLPICSNMLRLYCNAILEGKIVMQDLSAGEANEKPKLIKGFPKFMAGDNTVFARIAIVAFIGYLLSTATGGIINVNVMYLLVGIVAYAIGFLPKNSHVQAHANGFLMLCVMCICFTSLATISMDDLKAMVLPLIVTLLVGAVFIMIFGSVMGRVLKVDWRLAAAIAICCTIGYPGTQIITEEVCRSLDCDEETRAKIHDHVLPPIIVSGFTTVTIASVFFAGFIIPMIF
ncbi:MAG: hypothetical protein IKE06_00905 [Solobacterium sp.]|nr:hypothetical protein [Solobacterium sp.]MBR3128424.1 hypothetical protein [Solobacterium sp.]